MLALFRDKPAAFFNIMKKRVGHYNATKGSHSVIFTSKHCKHPKRRKRLSSRQFIQKAVNSFRKRPTGAESVLQQKLEDLGVEYKFQWAFYYRGYAGIADFYLPAYSLIIEVDGGYHCNEEQRIKDRIRDQVCADNLGKPILRLVNSYVIDIEPEELKRLIERKQAEMA